MATSNNDRSFYLFGLKVLTETTGIIAIPAIAAALLGKYLDQQFASQPVALIICVLVAFILSAVTMRQEAKKLGAQFQELVDQNPSQPKLPKL